MTDSAVLIYPHQLYRPHPALNRERQHWLIEDLLFFGDSRIDTRFHKLKLMLHRASMQRYADEVLEAQGYAHRTITHAEIDDRLHYVFEQAQAESMRSLHVVDPTDYLLERRIRRYCKQYDLELVWYESPNFVTDRATMQRFWDERDAHDYFQTDFYIWQRQRLNILLTDEGKAVGGKWTYDSDNRNKLKANVQLPDHPPAQDNVYVREARVYVEEHFPDHPGDSTHFIYPTNHTEAEQVLAQFLAHKLDQYGTYQDAITHRDPFVFHSLLSAPFNIGLLAPMQIVNAALDYYHEEQSVTRLASLEGFIRQIIGWREFMRAVYVRDGTTQRTDNFWGHNRQLSSAWYDGTLGIPPVDDAIRKAQRYAYNHHIERLMLVGNLMLLSEIHPNEVYRWFMEMFIDAYDWVMVPNVYGMSQYADGGLITTKPYISSSNYVRKMSDYKRGDWCDTWDGLYWRFIEKHREFFKGNPRLAMMTSHLKRMDEATFSAHQRHADAFFERI
ncbi:MAG: cryptochrome/photolyase family protein [Anaerolineae bacterium]